MLAKLQKDMALKPGEYRLAVPFMVLGGTKNIDFVVDANTLNTFKFCEVRKIDFLNYNLVWDYSYFMSDDDSVYDKGAAQAREINKLLHISI